jgi:energy-coupling factor transport system permease protein
VDILRSLTIGLHLEQPITWLHRLDPRIKLFWLLSFLLSPTLANPLWRLAMVITLVALTILAGIPARVWKQQMGLLLLLATMTFAIATFSPDGLNVNHQSRRPIGEITALPDKTISQTPPQTPPPQLAQPTDYRYILFKAGNIQISQHSLNLGTRISTLIFTYLYAPTLYLLVTAPEEITAAITSVTMPLKWLKVPIVEITLTLTLALRFLPLVLEEVQNLVRAIRTRAINWKRLGLKRASQIWLILAERLITNLFTRAEQSASAMQVRGFTSPDRHQVRWNPLKLIGWDWLVGILLCAFWGVRIWVGGEW